MSCNYTAANGLTSQILSELRGIKKMLSDKQQLQQELDAARAERDMHKTNSSNFLNDLHATQKQLADATQRELNLRSDWLEAMAELKNKDAVRLWNECENLKKQLVGANADADRLQDKNIEALNKQAEYYEQIADYEKALRKIIELGKTKMQGSVSTARQVLARWAK